MLLRQAQTALGTAAGKDLAAVGSRHSLAETVDFGRMQLLGLVSTLRHRSLHLLKDFTGGAQGAALTRRRRGGPRRRSGLVRAHKCAGGIIPEFLSNVNSIIHVFPPFSKFPALFSGGMPLPKILFQKRNKPPNIDLFRRKILVLYIK